MRKYFIKSPWWLKKIYPKRIWNIDTNERNIYLTFDDGPHPVATAFVLDELKKYNAKATFFCIGKNVMAYPDIYKRILDEGHRVGNHTQNHLNGWKVNKDDYLMDIAMATLFIESNLFRPPYGRIRSSQAKVITRLKKQPLKIVMWSILSGDFDTGITQEECLKNVTINAAAGSIIVFHDSEKAFNNLQYTLPAVLNFFAENKYELKNL